MQGSAFVSYMPPVGGAKQTLPELTDHCRPAGEKTHPEHAYPSTGPAICRRCGMEEKAGAGM
ncbi:hypothetical protein J8N05_18710 [Streptomyces sp. BH-SS-21]|uniref:Uncharacterized protein n=1 Tax=Streptomyces liliiviolaceus TaxID=2823109 RepID=A0A941BE58_9ACTN|nr:hypothetical protein [Streptomyces liliiviolaceus]MBQ0850229.1 hypothetical protein [Streptomyces liliiviolaceus]